MFKDLTNSLEQNLAALNDKKTHINQIRIGLERETLRINKVDGRLSSKEHPKTLGSPLTNSNITTDFAESMLEFVTDPYDTVEEALSALTKIQEFTLSRLDNEILWPNSMPPAIDSDDEIQIAEYGESNSGKMKRLYRKGLSLRYGKMMQAISGIHFNFSLKDSFFTEFQTALQDSGELKTFKTERYLHLCRNIARFGYAIPYFIGASPIMCKSFLQDRPNKFEDLNKLDSYTSLGHSLRLSDIGYGNNKCHFDISFNQINEFIKNIYYAITTICSEFSQIPVKKDGQYQQINNHILQIENEYYSSIRPKQVLRNDENFLVALKERGIEYVELRSIDINPYFKEGIDLETMKFLQALLTTCLLTDAPALSQSEYEQTQKNIKLVAENGRRENFHLTVMNMVVDLPNSLQFILEWMRPVCEILGGDYLEILDKKVAMIKAPEQTPAAKIIKEIKGSGLSYHEFFLAKAQDHYINKRESLTHEETAHFQTMVEQSLKKQAEIEAKTQIPFDQYLDNYFDIKI